MNLGNDMGAPAVLLKVVSCSSVVYLNDYGTYSRTSRRTQEMRGGSLRF